MYTFTNMPITPNKALATKVLSSRVTPDVYDAWNGLAESTGRSVSECLRDAITVVDNKPVLKAQDGMVVPDELTRVLGAIGGGTVVGILAFKGLKSTLSHTPGLKLSEEEIEALSIVLGLAAGLFVGAGIHKALSK